MGYQPSENCTGIPRPEDEPLISRDQLVKYFKEGCKKPEDVRIGMEVEKHGICKDTYKPICYLGKNGLRQIQQKLIDELDWKINHKEGRFITSMIRGRASLDLESNQSMCELAGSTHLSIHDLARELRLYQHELTEISRLHGVIWLGIGHEPFAADKDLKVLKIHRYLISQLKANKPSIWNKIASVQANIDYTSFADARYKFQMLLRLSPFLSAMYAHSPLKEGKNTGFVSYRGHLFRESDQERTGIQKEFFEKDFGVEGWIDFCMKLPMRAIFRKGKWIPMSARLTFTQFLKHGYESHMPILGDWILHLSYIYTDVRMRRYIEFRVCDSLPPAFIPSLQAIVKAFMYHPDGVKSIEKLTKHWSFVDFKNVPEEIAKYGMGAEVQGKKLLVSCKEILGLATTYLNSFNVLNEKNENESIHLEPIKEFVFVKEKSPGQWVMENWDGEWKRNPEKLIEWCSFK